MAPEAKARDSVRRSSNRDAGREERRPCAEDDGVDDQLVLVDETALDELGGERRPADLDLAVELRCSFASSSPASPRTSRAPCPTNSSSFEKTTF